jgi:hypothetical protein
MKSAGWVLGYHGCDRAIGEKVIAFRENLEPSQNPYDWLGHGIYFWEGDPQRALHWATLIRDHPKLFSRTIKDPFVVGAIIDLGSCLDLTQIESLEIVREGFRQYKETLEALGQPRLPTNESGFAGDSDLVKRKLDCA